MKRMMKNIINVILGALLLALISCGGIGGGLGGNSDSDEKAYIGFSADVARFVVASQKLAEADVCKVELVAEKILDDGKTENVKIEGAEWKSLADLRKATLEFYKGTYNFYLNLYAETEIYEDGAYHLKLVQTAKIENKEIVAGKNTLTFNSNYVDTGDLAVGWACSIADGKVCPANYAIGTLYNIDDPKNVKNITLWNWDDGEKKTRNFAVVEKDLDNGFYVLDVAFYDKQIVYPGNEARYEGANLLATKHAIVAVNGFQTYKAFEIDFDEIAREGDAYPMEKEYQLDISVDSALIGSNFNHIFADLRYFPSNSKYLSQLKNLVVQENCISADGGRKLLKNSEGFLDLADKSKWLGNFDNNDEEDAKRKISINETNNTLTMTRTVKVTPGLDGKGYFFLTILYENRDIPGYAIDTFALPADAILLEEDKVNHISLTSYERDTKAPVSGSISWTSSDVGGELHVEFDREKKHKLLNRCNFSIAVLKHGGNPENPEDYIEATDWKAKFLYGGKDINDFAPAGKAFYFTNTAKEMLIESMGDQIREQIIDEDPNLSEEEINKKIDEKIKEMMNEYNQPDCLAFIGGNEPSESPIETALPFETAGRYQLFVSCKVNGVTLSDTFDIDIENMTRVYCNLRTPPNIDYHDDTLRDLEEDLSKVSTPVYLQMDGSLGDISDNDLKQDCISATWTKINHINMPFELDISGLEDIEEIKTSSIENQNIFAISLIQEKISSTAIKVGSESMPCAVTICYKEKQEEDDDNEDTPDVTKIYTVKYIHKDAFEGSNISSITFEDEEGWYATKDTDKWASAISDGIPTDWNEGTDWIKVEASDGKTVSQKLSEMLLAEESDQRWYIVKNKSGE